MVPGKQTMVSIQEQRVTFLPPPWGVCDSGSDKSDYLFYDTYSIPSCRLSRVFKAILKTFKLVSIIENGRSYG